MGELGCYGGGILRGADTRRMDQFAREGTKLTHYVVEPQCTPTRSALMTGPVSDQIKQSHHVALGGNGGGIVSWERTIAEILSEAELCDVHIRQVAYRRRGWTLPDRSWLR